MSHHVLLSELGIKISSILWPSALAEKYHHKDPTAKRQFQHQFTLPLLSHPSWWLFLFSITLFLWSSPPSPLSNVLYALFPFQSFTKFVLFCFFLIALNMSLCITQQQIYLNVSMLLLSRSECALQFKPASESRSSSQCWIIRNFGEIKNQSCFTGTPWPWLGKCQ